jgi:putative flavoprotein involved in K+ transport
VDDLIQNDVVVVGGGQAALALGFYLRRCGLSYTTLDDQPAPGGSWQRGWASLRAFSPAQWTSLPGWLMPASRSASADEYPSRDEVVKYLAEYETRYALPVQHGIRVIGVDIEPAEEVTRFRIVTDQSHGYAQFNARAVISATGGRPHIPEILGRDLFRGRQLHSQEYIAPDAFRNKRVVVVGGGNSAAQIVAELSAPLSQVASVMWATREPPRFLPDDIDGRYLFDQATARYKAQQEGRTPDPPRSLGDIVMVPPVRAARDRGSLVATPMFERLTEHGVLWSDNHTTDEDIIIWATGFVPALDHLAALGILKKENGRVDIADGSDTRTAAVPGLWLVGYGNWTGYASATLIGVGRSARMTVAEIRAALAPERVTSSKDDDTLC